MSMSHPTAQSVVDTRLESESEWDTIAMALNRWGILHVAPGRRRRAGVPRTAGGLIERLVYTTEPRLHQALMVLLLTHPQLAEEARQVIDRLEGAPRDRAMRRYVAAAALQRMARTRIALRLSPQPLLPAAYLYALHLPPLDEEFGRASLLAVAAEERNRYGYDAWGTYRTLLDLFLGEIRHRDWGITCDSRRTEHA